MAKKRNLISNVKSAKGRTITASSLFDRVLPKQKRTSFDISRIKRKKITTAGRLRKVIPHQPKLTPERLFVRAAELLAKFGKKTEVLAPSPIRKVRRKFPKSYAHMKPKAVGIFSDGNKMLTTHNKTFLRREFMNDADDPSDIMQITLSANGVRFFEDIDRVYVRMRMIDEVAIQMRRIHSSLQAFGITEINRYVPKDTGLLRWSLITSMSMQLSTIPSTKPGDINGLKLRIGFYSDLDYIKYVNEPRMIISKKGAKAMVIAHHKSKKQRSRKTGEYLHDPNAKFRFMSLIRLHLKTRARQLTRSMLSTLSRTFSIPYNEAKSLFRYKGYKFR